MGILSDGRLRRLAVAFVAVVVVCLAVVVVGSVAVASTVLALVAGEVGLLALVGVAAPAALVVVALSATAVALASWMTVRAVRLAEPPRSDRLAARAEHLERFFPPLRAVGLADAVTPTVADRHEALKERYARGELTEREFEREVARLLDEERDDPHPGALEDVEHRLAEGALADGRTGRVDGGGRPPIDGGDRPVDGDDRPVDGDERPVDGGERLHDDRREGSGMEPTAEREQY